MRGERIDDLREQALAAAEGLSEGEHALVEVLREIEREKERAADGYRAVVRSLAAAIEARDGYTGGHSDEVQRLSTAVAHRLGLDKAATEEIRTVALLHDVGKIGIPDHVLHNPDPLTREEWAVMRQHPVIGERILEPLPGLSEVARAVRHEHERWDGTGYPDGLAGEDIPLAARVVLACDAYHALVSDRPYRSALPQDDALRELEFCAGTQFDPAVIDALVTCVREPEAAVPPAAGEADDDTPPFEPESRHELELRALITVAAAVAAAHGIEDVIETAAEEARRALDAGSLSISKFEDDAQRLRTLINVGALGEGEERFPTEEVYSLDDFPRALHTLGRGEAHMAAVDDPTTDRSERELLRSLGKQSAVAVPIVFAGGMWGELYATRATGDERFTDRDVRFLRTISGQVGAAIGRAELFTGMTELAFKDSLTGLANRRALDERLEAAVAAAVRDGDDLSLVLCDMDNLKHINDSEGHQAGDDALVRVAEALRSTAHSRGGAMVGRIGGDEFCILLPGMDAASARTLTEEAMIELAAGTPRLTLSCGIASVGGGARRPADLVRAADAAQYTAKRTGRRRVYIAQPQILGGADLRAPSPEGPTQARRRLRDRDSLDLHRLLEDTLARLDTRAQRLATPLERLAVVVSTVGEALDSTAWTVSYAKRAKGTLRTMLVVEGRDQRGLHFDVEGKSYDVDAYPETRRILDAGGAFVVAAEDEEADPAERRLLEEWSLTAVLAAAAPGPGGSWLAELYADERTRDLHTAAPYVRLLVAEAVRGAAADPPLAQPTLRLA
jgi:diguanylate cyclase (GGDEF)-like protein